MAKMKIIIRKIEKMNIVGVILWWWWKKIYDYSMFYGTGISCGRNFWQKKEALIDTDILKFDEKMICFLKKEEVPVLSVLPIQCFSSAKITPWHWRWGKWLLLLGQGNYTLLACIFKKLLGWYMVVTLLGLFAVGGPPDVQWAGVGLAASHVSDLWAQRESQRSPQDPSTHPHWREALHLPQLPLPLLR